jgi:opacity protein-like surface antigen
MGLRAGALIALALGLTCGPLAYAGEGASVGPRLDFFRPDDADHGDWAPGVQLNLHLTPLYALQGSMDWAHYTSNGTNVRATPIQATLLGYFSANSPISPYLLIGGGWYPTHADGPYNSPRLFGPHVGAGLEIQLGSTWSIDGSYRFLWTQILTLTHPYGLDYSVRGHMFTVAVNYRL